MRLLPPNELAKRIDYALLRNPTPKRLQEAIEQAEKLSLRAVTTYYTMLTWIEGTARKTRISVVVDFPNGASHIEAKIKAVEQALTHGADEVEFVVNVWQWIAGRRDYVVNEVKALSAIARATGAVSKAIIESSLLTHEELRRLLEALTGLEPEKRPDYVKMNTGWFSRGVLPSEVKLASLIVKPKGIGIKAAGGIRDAYTASLLVQLGADIIGTSSPGTILEDAENASRLEEGFS